MRSIVGSIAGFFRTETKMVEIKQRLVDDVVIIELKGKLIGDSGHDEFERVFEKIIERGRTRVIINLQDVQWINSTAIGLLLKAYRTIHTAGGKVVLINMSPKVQKVFGVLKLFPTFQLAESEEEAIKLFGK